MATRSQNEREYPYRELFPDGGRRYWRDRPGKMGFQRMVKWVDASENTLRVVQEVYNDDGELIESHQKFPIDTGHQIIKRDSDDNPSNGQ